MYPINKYLLQNIFDNNHNIYQEFMCGVDIEYNEIMSSLKNTNIISEIRKYIHKLLGVVSNLVDKNYEMIYYCKLILFIDKTENNINFYTEYIKMILSYDKSKMGLASS